MPDWIQVATNRPMADQRAAGISLGGHKLGTAICEVQHLQCTGIFNQAGDVLGNQCFRANQYIDRHCF